MDYENTGVEDQVTDGQGVEEAVAESQQKSDKEMNFAALRESKERAEREADEYKSRLQRYEKALMERNNESKNDSEDVHLDFSDAIDGDYLSKIAKSFDVRERRLQQRLEQIEGMTRQSHLASKDSGYMDVINTYLPKVIADDPGIKEIIANTPVSRQTEVMYTFAKTNSDYVKARYLDAAKADNRISEEKHRLNSAGAMDGAGRSSGGGESPLTMDANSFYGEGGYLSKILEGKIK